MITYMDPLSEKGVWSALKSCIQNPFSPDKKFGLGSHRVSTLKIRKINPLIESNCFFYIHCNASSCIEYIEKFMLFSPSYI